jgi:hypothetical protein
VFQVTRFVQLTSTATYYALHGCNNYIYAVTAPYSSFKAVRVG